MVKSQGPAPASPNLALWETIATMIINVPASKSVASYSTLYTEDAKFPRNCRDPVDALAITMVNNMELDIATQICNADTDINVALALMGM